MKIQAAVLCAASATLLAACAGGGAVPVQPFALIEPDQRWVNSDTRPAYLLEADGEQRSIDRIDPVMPGVRKLVVSVPAGRNVGMGYGGSRRETITLDVKPCVRYYLAARRAPEGAGDWNAFVAATEAIDGCRTNPAVR